MDVRDPVASGDRETEQPDAERVVRVRDVKVEIVEYTQRFDRDRGGEAHLRLEDERNGTEPHYAVAVILSVGPRREHVDLVTATLKLLFEQADGGDHAVDLRRVRVGEEPDAHEVASPVWTGRTAHC